MNSGKTQILESPQIFESPSLATSNTDLRHLEVFSAVARFFDLYEGALELTASGLRKQVECREHLQFSLERL